MNNGRLVAEMRALDERAMSEWIFGLAAGDDLPPHLPLPLDGGTRLDVLMDKLQASEDAELACRIGNATCDALRLFYRRGGDSMSNGTEVLREILLLLEALPCSPEQAKRTAENLLRQRNFDGAILVKLIPLVNHALANLVGIANGHEGVSKVGRIDSRLLEHDLASSETCVAAYCLAMRLDPWLARDHLASVLRCMRKDGISTRPLAMEMAIVCSEARVDTDDRIVLMEAVADSRDKAFTKDFHDALQELGGKLVDEWGGVRAKFVAGQVEVLGLERAAAYGNLHPEVFEDDHDELKRLLRMIALPPRRPKSPAA